MQKTIRALAIRNLRVNTKEKSINREKAGVVVE